MLLDHPVTCYAWLFDALMLGVGVGFNLEQRTIRDIEKVCLRAQRFLACVLTKLHAARARFAIARLSTCTSRCQWRTSTSCGRAPRATSTMATARVRSLWCPTRARVSIRSCLVSLLTTRCARLGWVRLLVLVLRQHFPRDAGIAADDPSNLLFSKFRYNTIRVRPKGTPIKRFGGVASGHETLVWGEWSQTTT